MTNKQHAYNWIQNIIDSAAHDFHFEGVDRLIELFEAKYNDAALTICLLEQRQIHWNNIHSIIN